MNFEQFIPNIACAVLFAKDLAQVIPGYKLRFLRFEGVQEGTGTKFNAIKDIMIEGNIPRLIIQVESVVESQVRDFTDSGLMASSSRLPNIRKLSGKYRQRGRG